MVPSMIERIHLRLLVEVERQGSLTAAASALHLTQSALSHTIKKLEQQLGTKLWNRDGRKLQLTNAGEYLLRESKRLLPQLERVDEVLKLYADEDKGKLSIGIECHPCYRWLIKVVEPFLTQWPQVDVDVKQQFQFGGVAALYNREIDILVTPDPIQKPGLTFESVFQYEQVLVVNDSHPLATFEVIEPHQLADQTLYTYPVALERLDIYQQFLLPAGYRPKQRRVIEATELMLQMVCAQRGVASLPAWLVEEFATRYPIRAVRLGEQGVQKRLYFATLANAAKSRYCQDFVEQAKQADLPRLT